MSIKKTNIIYMFLILVFILFIVLYSTASLKVVRNDVLVVFTFLCNGTIWIALIIKEIKKRAYSISMMHWLFCFFFFFLAGFVQYLSNIFPWSYHISDDTSIKSNILLMMWTIMFIFGRKASTRSNKKIFSRLNNKVDSYSLFNTNRVMLLSLVMFLIVGYRIASFGITNFMKKSVISAEMTYSTNSSMAMLIEHFLIATSCFITLISIALYKKNKSFRIYALLNTLLLFIAYFPTTISRYAAAAIYGSVFILLFPKMKKSRFFVIAFLFSFVVIFPFMNYFRYKDLVEVNLFKAIENSFSQVAKGWYEGHYDAYTTFSMSVDYVTNNGPTYGNQLLGVLLFFVPRSIWGNKPYGSGYFLASSSGMTFTNISCPIPAEGLLNFGLIGLALFGLLFGYISERVDSNLYNEELEIQTKHDILYPVVVLLSFFLFRGDMMSGFAYLLSYLVAWYITTLKKD